MKQPETRPARTALSSSAPAPAGSPRSAVGCVRPLSGAGAELGGVAVAGAPPATCAYAGAAWLERVLGHPPSALGAQVADLLGATFRGLYHLEDLIRPVTRTRGRGMRSIDWTAEDALVLTLERELATYDFDELTRLVVLAHELCVRVEVCAHGRRSLELRFTPRERTGGMFSKHPTIEEAVAVLRADLGRPSGRGIAALIPEPVEPCGVRPLG